MQQSSTESCSEVAFIPPVGDCTSMTGAGETLISDEVLELQTFTASSLKTDYKTHQLVKSRTKQNSENMQNSSACTVQLYKLLVDG